jgi:hypothetical protein
LELEGKSVLICDLILKKGSNSKISIGLIHDSGFLQINAFKEDFSQ